jgi:hypothetical protein
VDSGADVTTVPAEFLAGTPIDPTTLPPGGHSTGIGGKQVPMVISDAEIWWDKWKVCDRFFVLPTGAMGAIPFVLLGREDFFMRFNVSFEWSHKPTPRFFVKKVT